MSIATLPADDVFRTTPIRGLPAEAKKPDRKTGWIYGAKAMQLGPLNEGDIRPWKVDMTTLQQLTTLVNQSSTGAKMRFAHPNMSRDGMGRHLGRASNARIVDEGDASYVAVDSKLSSAAKRAPGGNLYDHVFDLAEETPEDFGLSIAPILDKEAMGKIEPDKNGLIPIRIKSLRAIDFVDETAATRGGLFSLDSDSLADLPAQATVLLDTFFSEASPDVIRGRFEDFLKTYLQSRGDDMTTTETSAELAQLKAENEALKEQLASAGNPKPPQEPPVEPKPPVEPNEDDPVKKKARGELTRRAELTALCKLAKCEADLPLFIDAGFSRAEAQDWLKSSGKLQSLNQPVSEGGNEPLESQTPDEKYGAEYEKFASVYDEQGLSREAYIKSRRIEDGLDKLKIGTKQKAA